MSPPDGFLGDNLGPGRLRGGSWPSQFPPWPKAVLTQKMVTKGSSYPRGHEILRQAVP
jgi:hypothetical protein